MNEAQKHVQDLIAKAAQAVESGDAMRFSQAALNAANAILGLSDLAKTPQ